MTNEDAILREHLQSWLTGCTRLVIMGIGNPLRGDDGAAIYVVRLLRGRTPKNARLLNCASSPENYIGRVERLHPTHILLIDAAELGLEPGRTMLVTPDRILGVTISTHAIPLSILTGFLQRSTNASQMLLGIQPKTVDFGRGLSKEVRAACHNLARLMLEVLNQYC